MYPVSRDGYLIAESGPASWTSKPFNAITFPLALHHTLTGPLNIQAFRDMRSWLLMHFGIAENGFSAPLTGPHQDVMVPEDNHQYVKEQGMKREIICC
jgi:hypothetical protein